MTEIGSGGIERLQPSNRRHGFVAKFLVIQPVLDAGLAWLAVVIALNAALAAFYYLRVVVHMYMYDPDAKPPALVHGRLLSTSVGVASAAVIVLGIIPNSIYEWAQRAALPIRVGLVT